MLSVIIPSKTERFLQQTIRDVLANARGEIEVLPVLDGYDVPETEYVDDPRVQYLYLPPARRAQKRHAINLAVERARGEYIMALDAHCKVAPGFDVQLVRDHKPDWVQIPRRNRLDAEKWAIQVQQDGRPPIDYEYFQWPGMANRDEPGLHGYRWDARTLARMDIPIDDTLTFQGSCWLMTREWYLHCGLMQVEGYTGWGQEAEEIAFTTRLYGGRVITNKNTWYAHLHKGRTYGRMYFMSKEENKRSYAFSYNLWVRQRRDFFASIIDQFAPLPNWPDNWKDRLWKS